jgi:hypothetical protein
MIQPELMLLAAKIGQGLATADETKVFLLQLQGKIAGLREFIAALPKLT